MLWIEAQLGEHTGLKSRGGEDKGGNCSHGESPGKDMRPVPWKAFLGWDLAMP